MSINPYIVFAGNDPEDMHPQVSAPTLEYALSEGLLCEAKFKYVEVIYMPYDDIDINEVVFTNF